MAKGPTDLLAFQLGQLGLDLVTNPLATPPGTLLTAQNVEFIRRAGYEGLGSRGSLTPLNWEELNGSVLAMAPIPIASPADLIVASVVIDPETVDVSGDGADLTAAVTAMNTSWVAVSTVPWVLITAGGVGNPTTSPTTLSYTVAPFTGTGNRIGKILVLGVGAMDTLLINQDDSHVSFYLGGDGGFYFGLDLAFIPFPDFPPLPDFTLYPWMFAQFTRAVIDPLQFTYWAGEYNSGTQQTPIFKWNGVFATPATHLSDVDGHVTTLVFQNSQLYASAVDRGWEVADNAGVPVPVSGRVVQIDTTTGAVTQFLDLFGHAHGDHFTMNARYDANNAYPVGWAPGAMCGLGDDCLGIMLAAHPPASTGLSPDPAVFPGWAWGPNNAGAAANNPWVGQMLPVAGNINDSTWSSSGGVPDTMNKPWVNPSVAGSFSGSPLFSILGDVATHLVRGKIFFTPLRSPVGGIQFDGVAYCSTMVKAGANPDGFGPYGGDPVSGGGFGYFVPGDHAMILSSVPSTIVAPIGGNNDHWYGLIADTGGSTVSMLNTGVLPDGARLTDPTAAGFGGAQKLGWLATNVGAGTSTPTNFISPETNHGVAWFSDFIIGPGGSLYVAYCSTDVVGGTVLSAKIYALASSVGASFLQEADVLVDFGAAYPGQPFIYLNTLYWPWVGQVDAPDTGFLLVRSGVGPWQMYRDGLTLTGTASAGLTVIT